MCVCVCVIRIQGKACVVCVCVCVTSRQTEQNERFNGGEREGVCMCMWIYPVASLVEKFPEIPMWCGVT